MIKEKIVVFPEAVVMGKDIKSLKQMINEDILYCYEIWDKYSHDKDKMQEAFHKIFFKYVDKIDGISEGMNVLFADEHSSQAAKIYRENVAILIQRLEDFKENNYSNDGLRQYYINKEIENSNKNICFNFTEIRLEIGVMKQLTPREKNDIMNHLAEIEKICCMTETKKRKWDLLRTHIIWLSGKEAAVALKILPLFLKI